MALIIKKQHLLIVIAVGLITAIIEAIAGLGFNIIIIPLIGSIFGIYAYVRLGKKAN
jgi:uncharacterized membrane protein YfcA